MSKVLVGISGGVDSSVTAYLLQQQGFLVEGVLLKQVNEPTDCDDYVCCAESAISRARSVCDKLGITLHTPDVRQLFTKKVIDPSIQVWSAGGVPSPCTTCNADVRAPLFNYYRQVLQCDYFASGHYFINDSGRVFRGRDPKKDQSYMVSLVDRAMLKFWLTPLGHMHKSDVRSVASEVGLSTASTPDSQNLCFNHLLPSFDREVVRSSGSDLIQIGRYTGRPAIGQRKGFGGDTVVSVDTKRILVGKEVPVTREIRVLWRNMPQASGMLTAQVAYHGKKYAVSEIGSGHIALAEGTIVSTGQVVAVYRDDELIGGGVIR
jgi:tRNA-specific 2-thiouridylase